LLEGYIRVKALKTSYLRGAVTASFFLFSGKSLLVFTRRLTNFVEISPPPDTTPVSFRLFEHPPLPVCCQWVPSKESLIAFSLSRL